MKLDLPQPAIEARVLAAVMTDPHWLELAADLESRDFWTFKNRRVFDAIRNLQAADESIWVLSVAQEIEVVALERDHEVNSAATTAYLGLLIACTKPPLNDDQFLADLRQLRAIATERGV